MHTHHIPPTRLSRLAALILTAAGFSAALPAHAATIVDDDFTGNSGGVPVGWIDFGPDHTGPIVESGGVVTISDGRANAPHLMQFGTTTASAISAFTATLDIASATAYADLTPGTGLSSQPQAVVALGSLSGNAIVVQFNTTTKTLSAFIINGPSQAAFTFNGMVSSYTGGALRLVLQGGMDRFSISCPALNYTSGDLLYASAGAAGFVTLADLGANAGLMMGTESAGSTATGTLAAIAFDRVALDVTAAAAPPASATFADHFTGNSGAVPAGWSDIGQDTNPASTVVENGSVVTITDTRGNGGPQFLQSGSPVGSIAGFSMKVDIASMTGAEAGSEPQAMVVLGTVPNLAMPPFANYAFITVFNAATKTFRVMIVGPTTGAYAVPGTVAYSGGALSFEVAGGASSFRITAGSFSSGDIPYTTVVAGGFSPAALGAAPAFTIGTESGGNVSGGALAAVAYDRVELVTTSANQAPVADAGADQSIHAGSAVTLNGTGSFDDNTATPALAYAWTFQAKPAGSVAVLNNATGATPDFVADRTGDYVVELVVTDGQGVASAPDTIVVSSNNVAPTAVATVDFNVAVVGGTVHFSGAGSWDPEHDALTYAWELAAKPSGSTASLSGATTVAPSLVVDKEGAYLVTLTVSDFLGAGTTATLEVVATRPANDPLIQIIYAADAVEALPTSQVTTKGNQQAFVNFLKQAIKALQKGDRQQAVAKLAEAITRTDGYALHGALDGPGADRDWITDRQTQLDVYALLAGAAAALGN